MGEDQKQHVELTRNIVQRFNGVYGDVFKMPEPYIPKTGARVMGLTTPDSKMSKSIPEGCVFLMEKPEDIQRKFKRAITDSDTENPVRYDPANKPGVANLMNIYAAVTGRSFDEIRLIGRDPAPHPGGGHPNPGRQGLSGERIQGRSGEGLLRGQQNPAQSI